MMYNHAYYTYAVLAVGIFTIYMAVVHAVKASKLFKKSTGTMNIAGMEIEIDHDENEGDDESALVVIAEHILRLLKVDESGKKEIGQMLSRAGITSENAVIYYLFFRYVMQPIALLIALQAMSKAVFGDHENTTAVLFQVVVSFVFTFIGLRGTQLFVENRRQKRQQTIIEAFPEVLDLMLVCIESGLGLDAALARVCKEMRKIYPDIVAELDRTRMELTMLGDRVVALQNLAERTDVIPFKTLVSSLIQTERFGTSLVETLRVLAEEMRTTRLYTAEQKAARIPVLITIPLILCILPAFILIIIAPPMVKVMSQGGLFGNSTAFTKPAAPDKKP